MTHPTNLLDLALQYHDALPKRIREYLNRRGIIDDILNSHLLGWNGWRITIPIYNRDGEVVFFKLAKDPEDKRPGAKMLTSRGSGVELYGWDQVLRQPEKIIICEGEFDRLVLEAQGFPAVTSTAGAATFRPHWAQELQHISEVYVCFDRDKAGRNGSIIASLMIPQAKVVSLPEEVGESGDVTDYFVRLKHSPEDFLNLLDQAKSYQPPSQPVSNAQTKQTFRSPLLNSPAKNQVDHIKKAISITDVVSQYITLRPSGNRFAGCCPFHDDLVPSFTLYPQTQTYYCFGCQAYGDVISFVQKVEQVSFAKAIEILRQFASPDESERQKEKPKRKAA